MFAAGAAAAYGVLRVPLGRYEPIGDKPSKTANPVTSGVVHTSAIGGGIGAAAVVGVVLDSGVAWPLERPIRPAGAHHAQRRSGREGSVSSFYGP